MRERVARKMAIATIVPVLLVLASMTSWVAASAASGGQSASSGGSSASTSTSDMAAGNEVAGLGMGASDGAQPLTSRVVHTKYGAVSGVIVHLDGRNLDPVEAFKGVPYASPPVGSLRFMPPVTGALWSGVKKADR